MPEPAKSPTDARLRLLEAAEEVFAAKGFEGASVRDICGRAGANVAAVNYYFGGDGAKERLYTEAVRNAHDCSFNDAAAFPDAAADAPPVERLRGFIRGMVSRMAVPTRPTAMQLVMREFAHPSAAGATVVRESIRPMAMQLFAIMHDLLPAAAESTRYMVGFSVIGQILYYRQNRPVSELLFGPEVMAALTPEMIADHVVRFTLAAVGHAAPITGDSP